jgi:hypothetical protein
LSVEEEKELLRMAASVGLSSTYDASSDTYKNWRMKVLALAQLLKEHEVVKTIQTHSHN